MSDADVIGTVEVRVAASLTASPVAQGEAGRRTFCKCSTTPIAMRANVSPWYSAAVPNRASWASVERPQMR